MIKSYTLTFFANKNEIGNADVPCGECTFCCERRGPLLTPEEFESAKYIYTIVNNNGKPFISVPVLETGCLYFKEGKCSIYDDRPQACRQYDCRNDNEKEMSEYARNKFNI